LVYIFVFYRIKLIGKKKVAPINVGATFFVIYLLSD